MQHWPSTGALIGQALALALALAETGDVASGLAVLNAVQAQSAVAAHQPYWVALGHLQVLAGRRVEGAVALQCAIGLTEDARERAHLLKRRQRLPESA